MNEIKPVTAWYRHDKFNHIEDGHPNIVRPTPKCDVHVLSWGGRGWRRMRGWLTADMPPRLVFGQPK